MGWIPGQVTKIPHAVHHGQKKKKKRPCCRPCGLPVADPVTMEEMSRSHCRKTNIVVIVGKYSPHSTSSGHSASHPFHLQNILKPSPKTTMSQPIMPLAQVISVRSRGVWIPQVQQFRLHFSSLNTRKFTWAPTQSIYNWLGHNVDTAIQKGRKQEAHSNCRSVSHPQHRLGTGGQFLMRVQLCCFVLWHLALLSGSWFCPVSHHTFAIRMAWVGSWVVFSTSSLSVVVERSKGRLSFHSVSVTFNPSWYNSF